MSSNKHTSNKMIAVAHKLKVKLPTIPNFVILENGDKISIGDLTDEGVDEITKYWNKYFRERVAELRKIK